MLIARVLILILGHVLFELLTDIYILLNQCWKVFKPFMY